MARMDETQHRLVAWTSGQHSERLAAQVLMDQGYEDLDPSHPYGGPDGGRDAICTKDGRRFVVAVYFPRGQQTYATIEAKLTADLVGARTHNPDGVVFVTNQELRLSERSRLEELDDDLEIVVFHMEKVAAILDQPRMHAIRDQFLDLSTGPPPLSISVDIDGAAHHFADSESLRDQLIGWREDEIRKGAQSSREQSPEERTMAHALWLFGNGTRLPDPMTPEAEQATVDDERARIKASWSRSETYLGTLVFPGVRFTVTNLAASFLDKVRIVITFHGAQGYEQRGDHKYLLERMYDPDFEPDDWFERTAAIAYVPRLASDPVDFENVDGDLRVTIDLPELRPQPEQWVSDPDEIVVAARVEDGAPISVSWYVTAREYGSAVHGELSVPVTPIDMGDALAEALKNDPDYD